jgi:hypothetical protein
MTYRPTARQRPQRTCGQQYRNSVFCGPPTDRCYTARARHVVAYVVATHNRGGVVFSTVVRARWL